MSLIEHRCVTVACDGFEANATPCRESLDMDGGIPHFNPDDTEEMASLRNDWLDGAEWYQLDDKHYCRRHAPFEAEDEA